MKSNTRNQTKCSKIILIDSFKKGLSDMQICWNIRLKMIEICRWWTNTHFKKWKGNLACTVCLFQGYSVDAWPWAAKLRCKKSQTDENLLSFNSEHTSEFFHHQWHLKPMTGNAILSSQRVWDNEEQLNPFYYKTEWLHGPVCLKHWNKIISKHELFKKTKHQSVKSAVRHSVT